MGRVYHKPRLALLRTLMPTLLRMHMLLRQLRMGGMKHTVNGLVTTRSSNMALCTIRMLPKPTTRMHHQKPPLRQPLNPRPMLLTLLPQTAIMHTRLPPRHMLRAMSNHMTHTSPPKPRPRNMWDSHRRHMHNSSTVLPNQCPKLKHQHVAL
ncbi:hypothetical protein BC629DRAFT_1463849 [Irpex lacteus]|nr:hypothetical protein BC629DRAFT_1463849 [Irpex lacteus]